VKQPRPDSSTTETVTTGYLSHAESALRLAVTPVTVTVLLVARAKMPADVPPPLVAGAIILRVVLPWYRRVVVGTLGWIFGLAFLLIGFANARKDRGDCLMRGLAKVASLVDGVPLPEWASEADPNPVPAADPASAPAPAAARVDDAKQQREAFLAASVRPADFSPPAIEEPVYDGAFIGMAECRPNGPKDVVDIPPADIPPADIPSRGRHAKAEPEHAEELVTAGVSRRGPGGFTRAEDD
jgi:hypothetical protein